MWSKPVCTSRKSASAERCLRPLGATIAMATPDRKTSRCSDEGLLSHRGLRKDIQEGRVITGFYRSPGIAVSQEKLPLSLGFFEFVHNVRKRGKALLGALIELLVSEDPGIQ